MYPVFPARRVANFNIGGNIRFALLADLASKAAAEYGRSPREFLAHYLKPDLRRQLIPQADKIAHKFRYPRPEMPRTPAARTRANLEAISVLSSAGNQLTKAEAEALFKFSGWGGLSLEKVADKIPDEWRQDSYSLLHEWYTPIEVADSVAEVVSPFLPSDQNGLLTGLEPSAGVGRFLDSFNRVAKHVSIRWTGIELNPLSGRILSKLHPFTDVLIAPFEYFNGRSPKTFSLIVCNPPYGSTQGTRVFASLDPDPEFDDTFDYAYFMRRSISRLKHRGIGVFIVPNRFMTGKAASAKKLRQWIFRRSHLITAYRLPNGLFPSQDLIVDVVVVRGRGGRLTADAPDDGPLIDGAFYKENPELLLGEEGTNSRGRYTVVGKFNGLPTIDERPECTTCTVIRSKKFTVPEGVRMTPANKHIVHLGNLIQGYLRALARNEEPAISWRELFNYLSEFAEKVTNPRLFEPLRALARVNDDSVRIPAEAVLRAFTKDGALVEALREPPEPVLVDLQQDDVDAMVERVHRPTGAPLQEVYSLYTKAGGSDSLAKFTETLLSRGFFLDGTDSSRIVNAATYLSGNLWERLQTLPETEIGESQRKILLQKISPAVYEDIDYDPRLGWIPPQLIGQWMFNGQSVSRQDGLLVLDAWDGDEVAAMTGGFLNWINHRPFDPGKEFPDLPSQEIPEAVRNELIRLQSENEKPSIGILRQLWEIFWIRKFKLWVSASPQRMADITNAYNQTFKGRFLQDFNDDPVDIRRWTKDPKLQLRPHQIRAVKARVATRGGILALAVGAGKTFTSLAILALGKQQGWIRRPVVVVPVGIIWQWYDEVLRVLPDYNVGVVGSKKTIGKDGKERVRTQNADERSGVWMNFQAGFFDMVLLADTALGNTRVSAEELDRYANKRSAMLRAIAIERDRAEGRDEAKRTEREKALLKHGSKAWLASTLKLKTRKFDPGLSWSDIGIDWLAYDETGNIRKTWSVAPRALGVPKYMGAAHEGSQRAWQADFRAALVRQNGGGILALSGTVGENSPAEPYNLLHFIDPGILEGYGIGDVEQFISRYVVIEAKEIIDLTGSQDIKPAVVGFKNLNELRHILFYHGSFVSHEQAGIKLPRSNELLVEVGMSETQRKRYEFYRKKAREALSNPHKGLGDVFASISRMKEITVHPLAGLGYTWSTAMGGLQKKEVSRRSLSNYINAGWSTSIGVLEEKLQNAPATARAKIAEKIEEYKERQTKTKQVKIEQYMEPPDPEDLTCPKFEACAERIKANLDCGHVVFVESTAAHRWLIETLVVHGVERNRIAVISGQSDANVTDVSRRFNGSDTTPRTLDVVIGNVKMTRGVNLQRKTCMLHHLDLRWTPADMEQRRGRIDRYGNLMPEISIIFYFCRDSFDNFMFDILAGKGEWRDSLFLREGDRSINPAQQLDLSQGDLWMLTASSPEEAKMLKEEAMQKARERELRAARRRGLTDFRKMVGRLFESVNNPDQADRLEEEASNLRDGLLAMSEKAFPYRKAIKMAWKDRRKRWKVLEAEDVPPLYEGLVLAEPGTAVRYEIGSFLENGRVGVRRESSLLWASVKPSERFQGFEYATVPPAGDDDLSVSHNGKLAQMNTWRNAHSEWVHRIWARHLPLLEDPIKSFPGYIPLFSRRTGLKLKSARDLKPSDFRHILPPSRLAWEVFERWAPSSTAQDHRLEEVSSEWWGRTIHLASLPALRAQGGVRIALDPKCSTNILAMKPKVFVSEVARLFETGKWEDEEISVLGVPLTVSFLSPPQTPDELRLAIIRSLYRNFLRHFEVFAQEQLKVVSGRASNVESAAQAVDLAKSKIARILGHSNARTIALCAQQAWLTDATEIEITAEDFRRPEYFDSSVSKARITPLTRRWIPVVEGQRAKVTVIDIAQGAVVEEMSDDTKDSTYSPSDELSETKAIKRGHVHQFVSGSTSWVDVHPQDVAHVFTERVQEWSRNEIQS